MSKLRDQLAQLCYFPPKTQPEYEYQNYLNFITQITQHLFDKHVEDIIKNFTNFWILTRSKSQMIHDLPYVVISSFSMEKMEYDFFDDQLALGYRTLIVLSDVRVLKMDNGEFVINIHSSYFDKTTEEPGKAEWLEIKEKVYFNHDVKPGSLIYRINEEIKKYDVFIDVRNNQFLFERRMNDDQSFEFSLTLQ